MRRWRAARRGFATRRRRGKCAFLGTRSKCRRECDVGRGGVVHKADLGECFGERGVVGELCLGRVRSRRRARSGCNARRAWQTARPRS